MAASGRAGTSAAAARAASAACLALSMRMNGPAEAGAAARSSVRRMALLLITGRPRPIARRSLLAVQAGAAASAAAVLHAARRDEDAVGRQAGGPGHERAHVVAEV